MKNIILLLFLACSISFGQTTRSWSPDEWWASLSGVEALNYLGVSTTGLPTNLNADGAVAWAIFEGSLTSASGTYLDPRTIIANAKISKGNSTLPYTTTSSTDARVTYHASSWSDLAADNKSHMSWAYPVYQEFGTTNTGLAANWKTYLDAMPTGNKAVRFGRSMMQGVEPHDNVNQRHPIDGGEPGPMDVRSQYAVPWFDDWVTLFGNALKTHLTNFNNIGGVIDEIILDTELQIGYHQNYNTAAYNVVKADPRWSELQTELEYYGYNTAVPPFGWANPGQRAIWNRVMKDRWFRALTTAMNYAKQVYPNIVISDYAAQNFSGRRTVGNYWETSRGWGTNGTPVGDFQTMSQYSYGSGTQRLPWGDLIPTYGSPNAARTGTGDGWDGLITNTDKARDAVATSSLPVKAWLGGVDFLQDWFDGNSTRNPWYREALYHTALSSMSVDYLFYNVEGYNKYGTTDSNQIMNDFLIEMSDKIGYVNKRPLDLEPVFYGEDYVISGVDAGGKLTYRVSWDDRVITDPANQITWPTGTRTYDANGVGAWVIDTNGIEGGGGPTPTCSDGIQNGTETGIDCGGGCTACVAGGDYKAADGLVIIETENLTYNSNWVEETIVSGYTGDGYLRYNGADHFSVPGNDVLSTTVEITSAGLYQFKMHNQTYLGGGDGNDVWMTVEDGAILKGIKGAGIPTYSAAYVASNGGTVAAGSVGEWFKVYKTTNFTVFGWETATYDEDIHDVYIDFPLPGIYTFKLSSRSKEHSIDRVIIYNLNATDVFNLSKGETLGTGSSGGSSTVPYTTSSDVNVIMTGEQKKWHTLTVKGTSSTFTEVSNTFRNNRMMVEFISPTNNTYLVQGFFAADGNAAESSATSGTQWFCHFSPDEVGDWSYNVIFKTGTDLAVQYPVNKATGTGQGFDAATGTFNVLLSDKTGRDFRNKGRLKIGNGRYLIYSDSNESFIKVGADSPETMLAYSDFDNTVAGRNGSNGTLKTWTPHIVDWQNGNPTWKGTNGKGLIGSINYLSSVGANAISFIPFNVDGDGDNVHPWAATTQSLIDNATGTTANKSIFDVSKLAQWDIVFKHAQEKGVFLHFKLMERENDGFLDGGETGIERKIYLREMVARFGYHLALNWNMGEEFELTTSQINDQLNYVNNIDPFNHLRVAHAYPTELTARYTPLLGPGSNLTGLSLQLSGTTEFNSIVNSWVEDSANAGKQWMIANDEQGGATFGAGSNEGVAADAGYTAYNGAGTIADNRSLVRQNYLYGTLFAGGWGNEYYYGYATGTTDLNAEDHRSRATKWADGKVAIDFFSEIGIHLLEPDNTVMTVSDTYGLSSSDVSVGYVKTANANKYMNLGTGTYNIRWFDPINGGAWQTSTITQVAGGSNKLVGTAPNNTSRDWIIIAYKTGITFPILPTPNVDPPTGGGGGPSSTRSIFFGFN